MDEREDAIREALKSMLEARAVSVTVPAPLLPDADAAYAVQERFAQLLRFDRSTWWKSGGPSRTAEQTHARLVPEHVWTSPADLVGLHFNFRGIEGEIALRLARDVGPDEAAALDVEAARALVDAMAPTIEVVDSRWNEALAANALARLADLQSHGSLVVGAWRPYEPGRDWTRQSGRVRIGHAAPQPFTGTHSMGDPAWVLPRWLRHATRHGDAVPAGSVVTTGTWCGAPLAQEGDEVVVEFDGIGDVRVQF